MKHDSKADMLEHLTGWRISQIICHICKKVGSIPHVAKNSITPPAEKTANLLRFMIMINSKPGARRGTATDKTFPFLMGEELVVLVKGNSVLTLQIPVPILRKIVLPMFVRPLGCLFTAWLTVSSIKSWLFATPPAQSFSSISGISYAHESIIQ